MIKKYQIFKICKLLDIQKYDINSDGSISVNGIVDLNGYKFSASELSPVGNLLRFKEVSGSFKYYGNNLKSLKGCCPEKVGGDFVCSSNHLTSLDGCPKEVGGYFNCTNNRLKSLKGCPEKIYDDLYCINNDLTSLEGCPENIRNIYASNNKITSFDGIPEFWSRYLDVSNNPVDEIFNLFSGRSDCIEWIQEYNVIQDNKVSKHRLEEVFHTLNMKMPKINLKNYSLVY